MAEAEVPASSLKLKPMVWSTSLKRNSMSEEARGHEEYRMGLETALKKLASIDAGKDIAKENAEVLATALQPRSISLAVKIFFQVSVDYDGLADKSGTISSLISRFVDVPSWKGMKPKRN